VPWSKPWRLNNDWDRASSGRNARSRRRILKVIFESVAQRISDRRSGDAENQQRCQNSLSHDAPPRRVTRAYAVLNGWPPEVPLAGRVQRKQPLYAAKPPRLGAIGLRRLVHTGAVRMTNPLHASLVKFD
jgi:hypothetical protein